jgi:hypothetical protein
VAAAVDGDVVGREVGAGLVADAAKVLSRIAELLDSAARVADPDATLLVDANADRPL